MGKVFDVIKGADAGSLDINDFLVKHPASTFFMEMASAGPEGSDIQPGDVIVIDRALTPKANDLIVVDQNGELTIIFSPKKADTGEFIFWGKVIGLLRRF